MRHLGRLPNQLRPISFEVGFAKHAEGSCFAKFGDTHVLCTATVEEKVPPFLRNKGTGWITAEYGMLPRSTHTRMDREAARGKQTGRTQEIQRLIGRSLRSVVNLKALGEQQVVIDCDVLQADGGTRTAAISGAFVALYRAFQKRLEDGKMHTIPMLHQVAAVSCGLINDTPMLDLDYVEDSNAQADANFVFTDIGTIIEIQATAEHNPFEEGPFAEMMSLAHQGIKDIAHLQRQALGLA